VAFDQNLHKFESSSLKAKRGESVRRKGSNSGSTKSESWMKKPINSDASWLPVAPPPPPPPLAKKDAQNFMDLQSPARVTASSSHSRPRVMSRRSSSNTSVTNPVSSDSSSSSERHSSRKANSKNMEVLLASPAVDVLPERSQRSQRSLSRASRQSHTNHIPPGAAATAAATSNRGRSSSRNRGSQPSPVRRRSSSKQPQQPQQQRQPSPVPPSGRGRSSSRTRTSAPAIPTTTATRRRSSSRSQRARSNSRTPTANSQRRSRSSSRTPSVQPRSRSTSRTGPTHQDSMSSLRDGSGRSRSISRGGPPPCTSRTRRELNKTSANSVGPGLPPRHTPRLGDDMSVHTVDPNLGRDITFGSAATQPLSPTSGGQQNNKNKRSLLMERLFGNQVEPVSSTGAKIPLFDRGDSIHPRILLTATVYHNTATNLWITTINTNQKGVAKNPATASKFLKAFSFASEREARESAIANAPPKMLPFTEHAHCFLCMGKFAVFRRAGHCRNCGVCVCNNCSSSWPARMIPDTYNLKKESSVKICKSCDSLSKAFKKALLTGNYEDAIALYGTGNINLRTPFPVAAKKDEIMYPIHCAVEGGNPNVVRWLMDDHFCPIKLIRTGSGKRTKRGMSGSDVPILTSKGRSVLTIAMSGLKIEILRYLVIERDVSVYEAKDLKSSLRALEATLQALPPPDPAERDETLIDARWDDQSFSGAEDDVSMSSSFGDEESIQDVSVANKSKASKRSNAASKSGEAVSISNLV